MLDYSYIFNEDSLPAENEVMGFFKETLLTYSYFFNLENKIFQLWTKEYIDALSEYLLTCPQPIIEVGAGKGLLSYYLRKKGVPILATDDNSWNLIKENKYDVKVLDYKAAIKKYKPETVIVSWMLLDADWTPFFREMNIKEYILIGEGPGGCTGSPSVFDTHPGYSETAILQKITHFCRSDFHSGSMGFSPHTFTTSFKRKL